MEVQKNIMNIKSGVKIHKITGPIENFVTAATKAHWGVIDDNKSFLDTISEGDILVFHATKSSSFNLSVNSGIAGFAEVGKKQWVDETPVWIQEFPETVQTSLGVTLDENGSINIKSWPHRFEIKNIQFLCENKNKVDFNKDIQNKTASQIISEIEEINQSLISFKLLDNAVKAFNKRRNKLNSSGNPIGFATRSSVCELEPTKEYHAVLNDLLKEYNLAIDQNIRNEVASSKTKFSHMTAEEKLKKAKAFKSTKPSHKTKTKTVSQRMDDETQKALIADIENYTCQVCGYHQPYQNSKGEELWIIDVDHILDKKDGHGEEVNNLWVLCPTCHREKTRGVVKINPKSKSITRLGKAIKLHHDTHLGWPETN